MSEPAAAGKSIAGAAPGLINPDIAPTPESERTWGTLHFAALWVGMSVCIPTYMLASSMIDAGMNWWQSLLTITLGNAIVLVPMVWNAHAGTKYGIPFPVFVRASFGWKGAHVPSMLRSIVACGWFGIQTWIGGLALHAMITLLWPGWAELGGDWAFMGHSLGQYLGFLLFWLINLHFAWHGTESIKWLETAAAPLLILVGAALFWWAVDTAGGFGEVLDGTNRLAGNSDNSSFLGLFLPWLTAMVGYWATLSLNIPDFTRYARSQSAQVRGQAIGLLTTMPAFAFIGIAATSATLLAFGEAIWNPIDLVTRLTSDSNRWIGVAAMAIVAIATLSTNIAANLVAPANSISNLSPGRISVRAGGMIAATIGILIFPWKLLDAYQTWLISYSGLLGAVLGVMVCDYVWVRRRHLEVRDLYRKEGRYAYGKGIHETGIVALATGILVAMLGKLVPFLEFLFSGAWFSAAITSFVMYAWLMARKRRRSM